MRLLSTKKMNFVFGLIIFFCGAYTIDTMAAADGIIDGKDVQLERAALNYEWAASAQHEASLDLLADGQTMRSKPYQDKAQYRRNMRYAGDRESRAGDLEMSAGGSYDSAAKAWSKIGHKKSKSTNGASADALQLSKAARNNAIVCYQRAAEIYEMAAQAYYIANQPLKQASLSQKAARVREKLAQRV